MALTANKKKTTITQEDTTAAGTTAGGGGSKPTGSKTGQSTGTTGTGTQTGSTTTTTTLAGRQTSGTTQADPGQYNNEYQVKQYDAPIMYDRTPEGEKISTDSQQLRGVSDETRAQQQKYQEYQQGDRVTEAQQQLQNVLDSRPQGYQSKYGATLDSILQQVQNPEQFNYSFNDDQLFQYYKDLYTQQGRQASMDAMGQAAGLTGGYGNSYAQAVGNQAYQQNLDQLYNRGLEFYDRAYQRYGDERADVYKQLQAIREADNTDYSRYRDDVGDWEKDRTYYTDAEKQAYDRDYNQFVNDRSYWSDQAKQENADWWTAENFNEQQRKDDAARRLSYDQLNADTAYKYDSLDEKQREYLASFEEGKRQYDLSLQEQIRQFNETSDLDWAKLQEQQREWDQKLTEQQRQYNQDLAYKYVQAIIAAGHVPSNELLVAAGLSKKDAKKMMKDAGVDTSGGTSGGNRKTPQDKIVGDTGGDPVDPRLDWPGPSPTTMGMTWGDAQLSQNADAVAQRLGFANMDEAMKVLGTSPRK